MAFGQVLTATNKDMALLQMCYDDAVKCSTHIRQKVSGCCHDKDPRYVAVGFVRDALGRGVGVCWWISRPIADIVFCCVDQQSRYFAVGFGFTICM